MGRKKRKLDLELKPFCYYCDREFSDEKVLLQHQKAKHFKCLICDRKLDLANSLAVHMMQVHKSNLKAVPNSLPKRSNPELNIRGMNGVPTELIEDNLNKLKQKINALNIKRQQKANNSFKKQRVPIMESQYFPYCSAPNYYTSPYMYPSQQNNIVQYPESFSNVSLSIVPNAPSIAHVPNDMTTSGIKNKNTENVTNYLSPTKEIKTTNGNIATKNDQRVVNGNNEKPNVNDSEIDISKEKHLSSATRSELKLNETYISNSISNDELSKSEEKITLTLMDPLNIFEDLPFKLPMFSSNASKIMQNEENNISSSFLPPLIPSNKMEISTNSFTKTNTMIDNATTTTTTTNTNTNTTSNKENVVTNNITASGISSVPPPPPFPPSTTAPPNVSLATHNPSVTSGRYVPFIPPPPTTPPTNSHLQLSPYIPTPVHLPTPPPPPSHPLISSLSGVSPVSSLPTTLKIPPTPSGLLATATATTATTSTSPFFLPPTIASSNITSNHVHSEFPTAPTFSNDNLFQTPLPQEAKELNMLHMNNGDKCNQTILSNRGRAKELLQGCNELNTKDKTTYFYNNSKVQHIQLNLPSPTDMAIPHIEGLTLFYNEQDFVYRVKAIREFGWSDEGTVEKRCQIL